MNSTKSEPPFYVIENACFICNSAFLETEQPWYIFNKKIHIDGQVKMSTASLLAKVLETQITEDTVHSTLLCEMCNANLLQYENLERRMLDLQQRVKQNFKDTLNQISRNQFLKSADNYVEFANENEYIDINDVKVPPSAMEIDSMVDKDVHEEDNEVIVPDTYLQTTMLQADDEILAPSENGIIKDNLVKNRVKIEPIEEDFTNETKFKYDNGNCICLHCQAIFPTMQQLAPHMRAAHNKQIYSCDLCDEIFKQKEHLNVHIEKAHAKTNEFFGYECEGCDLSFSNFNDFHQHRLTKHSKLEEFECKTCQKSFDKKTAFEEHMNTHTDERPYKCKVCGKGFSGKSTLYTHVKIHTERKRPFECDICKKTFLNVKNMESHKLLHGISKSFICSSCGKGFKSQHNLDMHSIVHTGLRPFECRTCGKSFARRSEIKDHERTHTGERPFKCDLCPLAFAQRANLSSHKKSTHFNEKLHKCEQCDRSFKRRRLLAFHIQSAHTGERPYKCEICGVGFVYPEHHKKHLLIHTGLKPYACEVCGKQFKSRDNRNAHRFVHSDKKPYECMQCGAGFMRKPQLMQHIKNTSHSPDTIIVNQPQINNVNLENMKNAREHQSNEDDDEPESLGLIDEEEEEEEEDKEGFQDDVKKVLQSTERAEKPASFGENFENSNLSDVKYLPFENVDNNGLGWM